MAKQKAHHYRTCRDAECQRPACIAYREGFEDGFEAAMAAAADEG